MNVYEGISDFANAEKDYPNVSLVEGAQGVAYVSGGDNPYFMDTKALKEFGEYVDASAHAGLQLNWFDTFTVDGGDLAKAAIQYNGGDAVNQLGAKNAYKIVQGIDEGWKAAVTIDGSDDGITVGISDSGEGELILTVYKASQRGTKTPGDIAFTIVANEDLENWSWSTSTEGVIAFNVVVPDKEEYAE